MRHRELLPIDPGYRWRAYARGLLHVVGFLVAFQLFGLASYWLMGGCASEAHCTGYCDNLQCNYSDDCGPDCRCVIIGGGRDGFCQLR